jgi:hypothetical protein
MAVTIRMRRANAERVCSRRIHGIRNRRHTRCLGRLIDCGASQKCAGSRVNWLLQCTGSRVQQFPSGPASDAAMRQRQTRIGGLSGEAVGLLRTKIADWTRLSASLTVGEDVLDDTGACDGDPGTATGRERSSVSGA